MKVGHRTLVMLSMLRKRSLMTYYRRGPACSLTISRMLLKGDIRRRAPGLRWAARCVAGPVPIDRPKSRIEFSGTAQGYSVSVRKS